MVEILEEHEAYPSALPARRDNAHSAWVTIQIGCDNSCTFCIVPIVRGPEISRRMGDIVARGRGSSRPTACARSRCSARTSTRTGATSAPASTARSSPTCCAPLDAVDGIERIRFTSPHPKDLRPETIAAMAECASVCEHLHLPLQSGSDRTLARMHRGYTATRYLERLAAARAAIPDLAVTTDIIVGFPGETDDDFARTLEVVDAAAYDAAYTFVFSPRPGTPAADMRRRLRRPPRSRRSGCRRLIERGRAARAGPPRGTGRSRRAGARRGAVEEGRRRCGRAAPARTSSCTSRPVIDALRPGGDRRRARSRRAAPHWLRGELLGHRTGRRRPAPASASRSRPRLRDPAAPRARRPHRVREVGARDRGRPRARRRRDRVDRLDAGLPRPRHRHRQADARRNGPRCRTIWSTSPSPTTSGRWPASRPRPATPSPTSRRGATGRCSSAAPVSTCRRSSTRSRSRPRTARCAPSWKPRRATPAGLAAAYAELTASRPGGRGADRARATRRRIVRALEVIRITGRPFSSFGAGLELRTDGVPGAAGRGLAAPRPVLAARIAERFARHARRRPGRRGARARAPRVACSRTARQAIGYKEVLAHLEGRRAVARRRARRHGRPDPVVRPAPAHVVPP